MMNLMGFDIVESALMQARDKQVRFPHSKKKRVRKKWAARDGNWTFKPLAFVSGRAIYCHPIMAGELRREMQEARAKTPFTF